MLTQNVRSGIHDNEQTECVQKVLFNCRLWKDQTMAKLAFFFSLELACLLSLRSHSVRDHIEEARRTLLLLAVDIISLQLSPEKSSPFFHLCFTNKCQRAGVLYILECIYFLHFFYFFLFFFLNVGKTVSVGPDVCLHTKNKKDLQLSDRNYSCSCKATN